jgi:DNA repair protein RecN (Recombination protein N)
MSPEAANKSMRERGEEREKGEQAPPMAPTRTAAPRGLSPCAARPACVLQELNVENLLLIEHARLRLAPGLNVLTGETGAGKTVLAHALDLLLGGRTGRTGTRAGIIRPGASEAYVEGIFDLSDALSPELLERLPDGAEEIVLARRISSDGRTRAYLNGRSATVSELREYGSRLVSFYGQHEHRKLTVAGAQLGILDALCGPDHALRLRACAKTFAETRRLAGELDSLRELSAARERELDLLEHELSEIDAAMLDQHEYDELLAARARLGRLDALRVAAGAGADTLAPEDASDGLGSSQLMAGAAAGLDALAGVDPSLDTLAERLRALVIESQDLSTELRGYCERIASEDGSLDEVEERLASIERLTRKHGGTLAAVLDHAARARARHDRLAGAEVALAQTTSRLSEAQAALEGHVSALRDARELHSPHLERAVHEQLAALAMGDATFEVSLIPREAGPTGGDGVEFMIAPNPGVPAGPLREIGSGGELSRVMLALATVPDRPAPARGEAHAVAQASSSAQATLVFDEVDAGIGGHTARAVGERLRDLGRGRQVLCITHLPQIASLGDRHFSVVKDTTTDPTSAAVVQLTEAEVVSELVRMLGADGTDSVARRHARDLRKAA